MISHQQYAAAIKFYDKAVAMDPEVPRPKIRDGNVVVSNPVDLVYSARQQIHIFCTLHEAGAVWN